MFRREARRAHIFPGECRTNDSQPMQNAYPLPPKDRAPPEAEIVKPDLAARFDRPDSIDTGHWERFPPRRPRNSLQAKAARQPCDQRGERYERQLSLLLAPRAGNCMYPLVTRQHQVVYQAQPSQYAGLSSAEIHQECGNHSVRIWEMPANGIAIQAGRLFSS
jgi:hypothetical protein